MNSHRSSRGGGHRRSNVLGLPQRNADARQRKLTQPARPPPQKTPGAQHRYDGNDEPLWAEPPKEIFDDSTNAQNDIWAAEHQVAVLLRQNPNESDRTRNTRYTTSPPKRKGSSETYSNEISSQVAMSGNQFGFGQPAGTSGTTQGGLFGTSNTTSNVFGNSGSANTTSGTTGGGLFGTAGNTNTSSNIFGGGSGRSSPFSFGNTTQSATTPTTTAPAAPQASSGTTLFGNTSGSTGGGLFGGQQQQSSTTSTGGSLFGNTASNASNAGSGTSSNIFGSLTNQSSSTAPSSTGGLFGGAKTGSTGSTFGSTATTPSTQAQKPLFGAAASNTTAPSTSTNTFGGFSVGNTATTPQPTRPSPLAQSTTPAGNPPSSIFGAQTNQAAPANSATTGAPAFKFPTNTAGADSAAASANTNKPLFGELNKTAQSTTPSGSGFSFPSNTTGSQTSGAQTPGAGATASAPSLFTPSAQSTQTAASTQAAASTTPAPAGLFGQTATTDTGASNTASLFGNTAQASTTPAASAPSGGGLFSQKPATGAQGSGTPSLFNPTQQSSTTPAASNTAPTASLFSNLNTQSTAATTQPAATNATPAAAPSTFSLGGPSAASSSDQPATTKATATPSLFGQSTTTTNAAQGTSTAAPSITIGAGNQSTGAAASTTGPAPPTTSRLAQKSMDEILTMWSTSLASHQKTFQQLATQVSKWDRQLVENSGKISSLYGRCFQAERDCTEVERQLSAVEHGQVELEAALERYEAQVDRMIESSGGDEGAVGGVEGERERTYKTAEVCSNRLSEMSHSLTDMIEEINVASNKLHNTQAASSSATGSARQDDPLAQIVRVLNSHLSQLQTIDEGARTLGQKVEQAQKDAQVLGQNQGVNGAGWVESFGRSYLGRS